MDSPVDVPPSQQDVASKLNWDLVRVHPWVFVERFSRITIIPVRSLEFKKCMANPKYCKTYMPLNTVQHTVKWICIYNIIPLYVPHYMYIILPFCILYHFYLYIIPYYIQIKWICIWQENGIIPYYRIYYYGNIIPLYIYHIHRSMYIHYYTIYTRFICNMCHIPCGKYLYIVYHIIP